MQVLITGATGFIGSHALEALVRAGHTPTLLVRDTGKAARVLGIRGLELGAFRVVEGDMTDIEAVDRALDGVDAVVHAAAAVATTGSDNDGAVAANVRGTRTILGRAVEQGVDTAVYLSTVAVFVPPRDPVIRADSPLATSRTPYGRSKIASERYVRFLQEGGAPIVTLYPAGVYGPDQPTVGDATDGLRGCLEMGWPQTVGGISIIDVRDLAQLIVAALKTGGPERWMAGGQFFSWREFSELGEKVTGKRALRIPFPRQVIGGLGWLVDEIRRYVRFEYPLTRDAVRFMTTMVPTDDTHTLEASGMSYRDPAETVSDTIRWMASSGVLKPRAAGVLAPPT